MTDVAVVGAGPAGLAAAERLAGHGLRVTVFDRMPSPARKFLLAGRGGLNLTHSEPLERMLPRYTPAAAPLLEAVRAFPAAAVQAWCQGLGEDVFTGSSGRVFPRSFKATPLLRAWLRRLDGLGITLRTGHRWTGWDAAGPLFDTPAGLVAHGAVATVLALGGASWPRLGADGAWVATLGALVSPLRPANMGFRRDWSPVFRDRFSGEPLKRVAASFAGVAVRGEALLTRDGIEGGVIYALSGPLREAVAAQGSVTLTLDLRPDLDDAAFRVRLGGPGVSRANALRRAGLAPAAAALVRELGARPEDAKALPLCLTGVQGLDRAISTAGGVQWEALNGWMLRDRPGVFLCGEMLDWEAPTGGYLLQACLSSGWAAADQVAAWVGSPGLGEATVG